MIIQPLNRKFEKKLFEFMNQDSIRHFWGTYDLQDGKERVKTWIALAAEDVVGYLMEINERIIHIRGISDSATPLLERSELRDPLFNIEPNHLSSVKELYTGFRPTDATSEGEITTYLSMKVRQQDFKPAETTGVRIIRKKDLDAVGNLLVRTPERTKDLIKGLAYGLFDHDQLVAFAAAPEMLENLAIIRGVYTTPTLRGQGYATKVCSAVVAGLIEEGKEAFLYVSRENNPALSVYRKLGFKQTGHVFLSFSAERKSHT